MSIKMASLMSETGETRSTLLFYVKEGLLEEPSKPKPNVHLYADDSIQRVRLIKLFKINFITPLHRSNRFLMIISLTFLTGWTYLSKN